MFPLVVIVCEESVPLFVTVADASLKLDVAAFLSTSNVHDIVAVPEIVDVNVGAESLPAAVLVQIEISALVVAPPSTSLVHPDDVADAAADVVPVAETTATSKSPAVLV
jgi:hypothetical protein